jgi:phytanoyl-CoA hydroxylase
VAHDLSNAYRRDGFVVVPDLLGPQTLRELREIITELVAASAAVSDHTAVYDLEPGHTATEPRVRRIKTPHKVHPAFEAVVRTAPVMEVLTELLGPNLRLKSSKLNMKAAHYGSPVEWHQDWAFYPHTNDDILAIGVMLEDIDEENGALLVIPGSHRGPVHDHHVEGRFCGAMDPTRVELDFSKAVSCTGKAGSCSFHHVRLVHGSAENRSQRPRPLMLYECAAADAWPLNNWTNLDEFDSRMLCGKPTLEPRLEKVPVRMPYPPALKQGSIYENQTIIRNRFFGAPEGLKVAT